MTVSPDTPTAGRFRSEARALHLLGGRIPRPALPAALAEAAGRGLPNARVTDCESYPDFWFPFSWINWLLGFEGAVIEGVYGNPP